MTSYEPPPILLGAEEQGQEEAFIPEEFLEEVVAAAVEEVVAASPLDEPKQKKKQRSRKKSTSSSDAAAIAKKRKRPHQPSKKDGAAIKQNSNSASSPPKKKRRSRPAKQCIHIGCTNQSQNGKVCIRHGALWSKKQCSADDCTKQAINGGVCRRHGAKIKECSHEGCSRHAKLGGACYQHSKIKRCSHNGGGCLNEAKSWGLCARHGGLVGLCYYKGCITETFWGLCQLHGGPEEDFCCFDGCSNCLVDDEESDYDGVKLCLHRGCIDLAEIGGVCDRHSDEAYLYPLCQPCDKNTDSSEGGEKALDKEAKKPPTGTKQHVQEHGNTSNGERNDVAKGTLNMSRGQKESTRKVPPNSEGKVRFCSGGFIDGLSCIMQNGSCITHPKGFWEAHVSKMAERNAAAKQTLPNNNNDVKPASKKTRPPKPSAPSKRRLLAVIGSSSTSNTAMASLLQASGRGEVIANDANNTRRADKTSNSVIVRQDTDHNKALEVVDRNCGEKDGKHCVREGCFRYVVEEGGLHCKRHRDTNTTKTCKYDGCAEVVPFSSTFCEQHVPKPRPKKPRPAKPICNHEGCDNKALKSGFCSSHKPKIIHKRCSHEGCPRFAKAKGVCITHGATIQRKLCSVDGCQNQAKRRRVCKKHGAYDDSLFVGQSPLKLRK
eukprot:scaffold3561_cov104-Skeletonema_dohrnii-CCMP3373.AAC.1